MSNVQDNAAPGIYHGNLISSLQSMRDRMMAVLVPKFGEAFDGDFDAMLEAINALKRIDTSPNGGTNALSRAYGYLWHVNHPEDIPTGHPFMSADRAAIEARKELRDMLTHEQRGAGINWVRQSLIDASPKGDDVPHRDLVPGVMRCAKCAFQLHRTNLYLGSGTTGPGDSKTEPCPNGCGPLWPVTWQTWATEGWQQAERYFEELRQLQDSPKGGSDARDAARYRWLRTRWGRLDEIYHGDSDRIAELSGPTSDGWDVSPVSLDAAIDAAMQAQANSHGAGVSE